MITKSLTNIIKNYNKPLSIKYFHNTNLFTYNLFSAFYKKFLFDKKKINYLEHFFKEGYQKIAAVQPELIDEINLLIKKQKPNNLNNPLFRYEVNKEIEDSVKIIIKNHFVDTIKELEDCYQADMKLSYIRINRNHGYLDDEEKFSNYFHTDGYIFTFIKFFINLHDVNDQHGPLELIKKKYAKEFLKQNYKNKEYRIFDKKKERLNDKFKFKNVGKKGDVLICRTTELMHRASKPDYNQYRDMLFLEFVLLPKKNNLDENKNIFSLINNEQDHLKKLDNPISKKLTKIKGIKNLLKTFFDYKKSLN